MDRRSLALFVCLITLPLFSQSPSSNPEVATITAVKLLQGDSRNSAHAGTQYEVSLKVDDAVYVVLFTSPNGSTSVEYSVGMNVVVQVGTSSIKFTKLGRTSEVPILRRESVPAATGIDWSRAPSEYFKQKLQHLAEKLDLTPDQQAKIKPILEQEAGEAGQMISNPVVSTEDKLKKLENIVRLSDDRLKPILSSDQWQSLQDMRKQQRQELRKSLSERSKEQGS